MDDWIRLRGIGWDWVDGCGLVWMVTPSWLKNCGLKLVSLWSPAPRVDPCRCRQYRQYSSLSPRGQSATPILVNCAVAIEAVEYVLPWPLGHGRDDGQTNDEVMRG